MSNKLNFDRVCRACLSETDTLKNVFSVCAPDVFKYCTSVEISEADPLPKLLCSGCVEALNKFYYFKQLVVRSDIILKQQCISKVKSEKAVDTKSTVTREEDNGVPQSTAENDSVQLEQTADEEKTKVCNNKRGPYRKKVERKMLPKKTRMKCIKCEKSFQKYENLEAHMRSHFGKLLHLDTHKNEKAFGCFQCGKKFAQSGNLKTHLIRHTGVKNIACEICDMKFYIRGDMIKHMRSHSADKPFNCAMCDKTFKIKSFLSVHMRTHTGERPFACDLCPKRFMSSKDLRNHRMIHTGEKPHKCPLCSQAFIQKCALNRHMKGHAKKAEETQRIIIAPQIQNVVNITPNISYGEWQNDA